MRCPHCGFHHLEPKERCLRCRKPMTGGLETTPPEESSLGLGTGESFTFSRPPATDPAPAGPVSDSGSGHSPARAADSSWPVPPVEIPLTRSSDEDSIIAEDSGAGSMELVIEKEAAPEGPGPAEQAGAAAGDESEVTASAPELEVAVDRPDDARDEAAVPAEKAAPAGEDSDETTGLAEGPEALAMESSAGDFESRARDEVEQALKAGEAAPPDAAEARIVAALAQEIAPAPAALPKDEASGLDAWKEAEVLLRAAEAADQEREAGGPAADPGQDSASPGGEIDPLDLPGDATAAAMRQIMETQAEDTAESDAPAEAEAPAATPAAPEALAASPSPPEPETSGASTGPSFAESRLDRYFEQSADDAVGAAPAEADEDSQIEIALRPDADQEGPRALELPLGEASGSAPPRWTVENSRGIRAVRGQRARQSGRPGAWLLNLRRAGAGLFDLAVWAALGLLLYKGAVLANGGTLHGSAWEWLYLVAFPLLVMSGILALVYGSLFGSLTGRTPGMMIFGLKLSSRDGRKPALARSFLRTGILILSLVPMGAGLLFALVGDKGALHDRLSGIRVERA